MRRLLFLIIALFPAVLYSCSEPQTSESFLKTSDKTGDSYVFDLDFTDSTKVLDLYLFSRIDCTEKKFLRIPDIKVDCIFISPSGKRYSETVFMKKELFRSIGLNSREFISLYRSGMYPQETGQWQLCLKIPQDEMAGFCGVGLKIQRKDKQDQPLYTEQEKTKR